METKIKTGVEKEAIKQDDFQKVVEVLLAEQRTRDLSAKNEKLKKVLLLLAKGAMLATVLVAPKMSTVYRGFLRDESDWKQWKQFNVAYLRKTIRRLEKQKIVEIDRQNEYGVVKITSEGRQKVYRYALNLLSIPKPPHWDGKWRMVFYDVEKSANTIRDKFRTFLVQNGFYPLQESVYIHAYPCEKEIEFLRNYLGIGSDVRMVIAEKVEHDQEFKEHFGV